MFTLEFYLILLALAACALLSRPARRPARARRVKHDEPPAQREVPRPASVPRRRTVRRRGRAVAEEDTEILDALPSVKRLLFSVH